MYGKTLLAAERLKVSFGLRTVLDVEKFELRDGDRIGLVGENARARRRSCAYCPAR